MHTFFLLYFREFGLSAVIRNGNGPPFSLGS